MHLARQSWPEEKIKIKLPRWQLLVSAFRFEIALVVLISGAAFCVASLTRSIINRKADSECANVGKRQICMLLETL